MKGDAAAVLVVDDDSAVAASLVLLLRQAGYRPAAASSPEEALSRLAASPASLVLTDMNFARGTTGEEGLAFLAALRERYPGLPVVLMTAWGSIELAVRVRHELHHSLGRYAHDSPSFPADASRSDSGTLPICSS